MRNIFNLFGRSPFAPLGKHMEKVAGCVHLLKDLFAAYFDGDQERVKEIATMIETFEHEADRTKNDIRNHLTKSLFMPIDRGQLLEILSLQDHIADRAEDAAVLCAIKPLKVIPEWKPDVQAFLDKNIETFNKALVIINELHELLESSFGGIEAEKVRSMVEEVAFAEHEADLIQRKLLSLMFTSENQLSVSDFFMWQRIFDTLGQIANLSESLANRIRMNLELK